MPLVEACSSACEPSCRVSVPRFAAAWSLSVVVLVEALVLGVVVVGCVVVGDALGEAEVLAEADGEADWVGDVVCVEE